MANIKIPNSDSAANDDSLVSSFASLKVTTSESLFPSSLLAYVSLKAPAPEMYLNPDELTSDVVVAILAENVSITKDAHAGIPLLGTKESLPDPVRIKCHDQVLAPEPKPNLLFIVLAIMSNRMSSRFGDGDIAAESAYNAILTEESLMASLNDYDVIMPRNSLKTIMTCSGSYSDWTVIACRPYEGGPLFIDRAEGYETHPGSIGNLFEKALTEETGDARKHHRVYAVRAGSIGSVKVALTGEIDAVTVKERHPVEIKTRPAKKPADPAREASSLVQALLGGVQTMVTGAFEGNKRTGNFFRKSNIEYCSIEEYASRIRPAYRRQLPFTFGEQVLKKALVEVAKIGVVYRITGTNHINTVKVTGIKDFLPIFPITTDVIRHCANAVIQKAEIQGILTITSSAQHLR